MIKGQLVQFEDGRYAYRRKSIAVVTVFSVIPVWIKRKYEYLDLTSGTVVMWHAVNEYQSDVRCKNPMDVMIRVGQVNDLLLAIKRGPDVGRIVDDDRPLVKPVPLQTTAEVLLNELLAIIHRDGGHAVAALGLEAATVDAMRIVQDDRSKIDMYTAAKP